MKIDIEKFNEAVSNLTANPLTASLSDENKRWLTDVGAPKELIDFFEINCFSSFLKFNNVSFNSPNEIIYENTEKQNQHIYKQGLLIIGSGLNGDPIVLNLENGNIGFVCHDDLWEEENVKLREIHAELNESIGSFYLKSLTNNKYPVDFYDAYEYIKNDA